MPVFFPNSGSIETGASDIECAEKSISISAPSFCRQLKSLAKALVVYALMMATAPSTEPRARRFVFPTNRMRDLPFFDDAPQRLANRLRPWSNPQDPPISLRRQR